MSAPPIDRKLAIECVRFVSGALADGFSLLRMPGKVSATNEGHRRYLRAHPKEKITHDSFRHRIGQARSRYDIEPSAQAGKRLRKPYRGGSSKAKVGPDQAEEQVLHWLRRPHKRQPISRQEIAARTGLALVQIDAALKALKARGVNIQKIGDRYDIPHLPPTGRIVGDQLELLSTKDNTFVISGIGDLHAGSKYCRWDVREDLIRRAEARGVQAIIDTGNWLEGEARFNRYELEANGLEQQCQLLANKHPKTKIPIYAVAGDDHEGWYAQREGIDIGKYAEGVMRAAGHDWTNLGFMEAVVNLKNANSGKSASLLVMHPGGGSAYALSYAAQKIVESFEGGEKPAVFFFGHFHKLWAGIIRNVWVASTGCAQDQTSFMRKRRIEAHVGGLPWVELEQDPRTGAILAMNAPLVRYFNTGYYKTEGKDRWSHHGKVKQAERSVQGIHR